MDLDPDFVADQDWLLLGQEVYAFRQNQPAAGDRRLLLREETAPVFKYERLRVYDMARVLRKRYYAEARKFPKEEKFALGSQLRRSAMSVVLNIVEGSLRRSGRDQARFTEVAHGSLHEAFTCIGEAEDEDYLPEGTQDAFRCDVERLGKALHKLMQFQLQSAV